MVIRPYLAFSGALLLLPVLLKYLHWRTFINDLRHPVSGSLMAPMSMALLILATISRFYLLSLPIPSGRQPYYCI
ncbi:tellurite resistance protein [Vibrio cholerae]|nr:tellurite resistance protein [Vibrio cholerae]